MYSGYMSTRFKIVTLGFPNNSVYFQFKTVKMTKNLNIGLFILKSLDKISDN